MRRYAAVALALLALVGCRGERESEEATEPLAAEPQTEEYVYAGEWGSCGSGKGQFNYPWTVAVSPDGNVYVADNYNYRIQYFSPAGSFIGQWGSYGSGNGQFNRPLDVAVSPDGNVYVADQYNNRVQYFTSSGSFLGKWGSVGQGDGEFYNLSGVAVAPDGSVYVADLFNDRVQHFTATGSYLGKWGAEGSGKGQFRSPKGVAVDERGVVYVADDNNSRVQYFTSSGSFLGKWGSPGSGDGKFESVADTVEAGGYVFVADRNRVQYFTSSGSFLGKWGAPGSGKGQFQGVVDIAVAPGGVVYVADAGNHRIQYFTPTGSHPAAGRGRGEEGRSWGDGKAEGRYWGTPLPERTAVEYVYAGEWRKKYPEYIAVGPDGTVYLGYVGDYGDGRIKYFDPAGTYLGQWEVSEPRDITVARNGDVYVTDWGSGVKRFTRTGAFLGERRIDIHEYIKNWYLGLAVAPNGNVYVAGSESDRIEYYTPRGKRLGGWGSEGAGDGEFRWPNAVAVAPNGWVYVNDSKNRRIQYFTPDGSFLGQKRFSHKLFHAPEDVAVAPNGHVYVADAGNHRVVHLDADGEVLGTWGRRGGGDGEFSEMSAIDVGPKGDVYVVDSENNCVQRFTAAGSFVGRWGTPGEKPGQFDKPDDIAVSRRGVVYVADTYNCRIQYFAADGSFLGAWDGGGWRFLERLGISRRRLTRPKSVAVAPNGDVYVFYSSPRWDRCSRFTATGSYLGTPYSRDWAYPNESPMVPYIAVAPNGNLYVGDIYSGEIRYFTPGGSLISSWYVEDDISRPPGGITIAPNGNVFIPVSGHFHRVMCFTPTGYFLGEKGETRAKDAAGGRADDFAIGPEGDLYVCHEDDDVVARYSPSGEVVAAWGGSGTGPGLFSAPNNIAVAPDGTVYVVDHGNNRVQYFRPRAAREKK